MRIIPVLDLLSGRVVRGVGGRRAEYRPVISRLTASAAPLEVARAFQEHFGFTELYLADLDAIGGAAPSLDTYELLRQASFRLWVDAGVRELRDVERLWGSGVERLVIGLETIASPQELARIVEAFGAGRLLFSLDLKEGKALGHSSAWPGQDAWSIATAAVAAGVRSLLVLDLARVGTGSGTGTEDLCARLRARYSNVEIVAGGGIGGQEDLLRLRACGADAALVASALHDGRLTRAHLSAL